MFKEMLFFFNDTTGIEIVISDYSSYENCYSLLNLPPFFWLWFYSRTSTQPRALKHLLNFRFLFVFSVFHHFPCDHKDC